MEKIPDWDRPVHEHLPRSRLCASCHKAIRDKLHLQPLRDLHLFLRMDGPKDLSQSLENKCRACGLSAYAELYNGERYHGRHEVADDESYAWIAAKHAEEPIHSDFQSRRLYLVPAPNCKQLFPDRSLRRSSLWIHWLKTCSESHEACRNAVESTDERQPIQEASSLYSTLPDRLIEISATDSGAPFAWRVVQGKDLGTINYVTLSHCWGSSQPLKLTKQNYQAMFELNECSILPRTFQDVINVAHELGLQHVWIDSLCIVQDDIEDWEKEASKMRSIYQNGHLNIAATWATGSNDGLFLDRQTSAAVTTDRHDGEQMDYILRHYELYYNDVDIAPLNRRGWVTQERYLAKRQLSFATGQIYWECHELIASEDFPHGIPLKLQNPSSHTNRKPTIQVATERQLRRSWDTLVASYSSCAFSQLSDRVIALAGLAEQMRVMTGDVYLAGLWKKDLIQQLMWYTETGPSHPESQRTTAYFVPSWSWLSVTGPAQYDGHYADFVSATGTSSLICSRVLQADVRSKHHSRLHNFTGGELVLQGILLRAQTIPYDPESGSLLAYDKCIISDPNCTVDHKMEVYVYSDEQTPNRTRNQQNWSQLCKNQDIGFQCMFIHFKHGGLIQGLLLKKVSGTQEEGIYIRVGVFWDDDRNLTNWLASRLGYHWDGEKVDFDGAVELNFEDPRLQDIVHTVTIV
jgi:hypothetical protein